MSFPVALSWLIAGIIIGAVAARLYSLRQFNQNKLQLELDESKQQLQKYRSEVSSHLETTQQLMSQLQDNYERIASHMASTRMQLVDRAGFVEKSDLNYLSADAAAHFRETVGKVDERRRKKTAEIAQQPLDYSGYSSGLMKTFPSEKKSEA